MIVNPLNVFTFLTLLALHEMVIGLPSSTGQLTDLTNSPGAGDNFFLPHNYVLIGGDDVLVPFLQKLII